MDSRIKKLFGLYESGKASLEEQRIVQEWFASYDNPGIEEPNEAEKASFFKPVDEAVQNIVKSSNHRGWLNYHWLAVAALVLIVFSFSFFYFKFPVPNKVVSYTVINAPKGKKKQFSLPDGSIVYLNSGSFVRVPSDFNEKDRKLSLSGEAYFLVTHNAAKPFTIRTGKLLITDLGTSFNVKAYPDESRVQVAVESGKVQVQKRNDDGKLEMFAPSMIRNQKLIYNKENDTHIESEANIANLIGWRKNQLCFVNASFSEIAPVLERWYNVSVKLQNNAGNSHRYTVSFNNEPLSKVLQVFEKLSGINYKVRDSNIIINLKK